MSKKKEKSVVFVDISKTTNVGEVSVKFYPDGISVTAVTKEPGSVTSDRISWSTIISILKSYKTRLPKSLSADSEDEDSADS